MKIVADENIPHLTDYFASFGEVIPVPGRNLSTKDLKGADALLVRSVTRVNHSLLEGSDIRFVGSCTAGIDHIDQSYLAQRKIAFSHAPGCNARSVVEYVLCALDTLSEKHSIDLITKTIGVIGKGQVGGRLYQMMEKLAENVIACDPLCEKDKSTQFVTLRELLSKADIVALHTPLTTSGPFPTHHMIGAKELSLLKPDAILINAGRGAVVDNQALLRALKSGQRFSVVLDVWENEPDVNPELLSLVDIGTPHIAGYSLDGKIKGTDMIYRAFCQHFGFSPTIQFEKALPKPPVTDLTLSDQISPHQAASVAMKIVYDIRKDVSKMQQLTSLINRQERQKAFDTMRKKYDTRREFNTLKTNVRSDQKSVQEKLQVLGFNTSA